MYKDTQLSLPTIDSLAAYENIARVERAYENDGKTTNTARLDLETKYHSLLIPTEKFNRKLVSYQANKSVRLHNWLKYKEGFSAELVRILLDEFRVAAEAKVLDPFAGSATTLLVAKERGLNATGIEILPVCHLAWLAKSNYREYDLSELAEIQQWILQTEPGSKQDGFQHLMITRSAFPIDQELRLNWYSEQFARMMVSEATHHLLKFILMSILEDISYTRKDGQYLRWDSRSLKAADRDLRRVEQGKKPYQTFDKGELLEVKAALLSAFERVISDLRVITQQNNNCQQVMLQDTALGVLPRLGDCEYDAVITSPPYCNRYDYTRTYALELAFLGVGEDKLKDLRQQLLSCTVESRTKRPQLESDYASLGRWADWRLVVDVIQTNAALQEVFRALETRSRLNELNNRGVVTMVEGYFTELAFIIFELQRVTKKGGHVAIVNDNVRYGGEMIPVDLLMTDLASEFGFKPERVYVLPQQKGNSSQQMGKYGREANRKSITVWEKI